MEKSDIIEHYWSVLLKEGDRPKTVYAFADSIGLSEAEFYEHFTSMEAIERDYWCATVQDTILSLEQDDEYQEYKVDQKLLAFFFTYIAHIQKHRSRFAHYFPKNVVGEGKALEKMKREFRPFVGTLIKAGVEEGVFANRSKVSESYDRVLWLHLLSVIRFYLQDESDDFQDTDAFIEKSLNMGLSLASHGVLDTGLDFVRFMVGKDENLRELSKILGKFIPSK